MVVSVADHRVLDAMTEYAIKAVTDEGEPGGDNAERKGTDGHTGYGRTMADRAAQQECADDRTQKPRDGDPAHSPGQRRATALVPGRTVLRLGGAWLDCTTGG